MTTGTLVVLTGASGAGKTTIARAVQQAHPDCEVRFFDSIGIPTVEAMAAFGAGHEPGGAWQRAMTLQWIERIAPTLNLGRTVLFEGQMRIAFIKEALFTHNIARARILLVDCSDVVRKARLIHDRASPELANDDMLNWARYLRREAASIGCETLNTDTLSIAQAVDRIAVYFE